MEGRGGASSQAAGNGYVNVTIVPGGLRDKGPHYAYTAAQALPPAYTAAAPPVGPPSSTGWWRQQCGWPGLVLMGVVIGAIVAAGVTLGVLGAKGKLSLSSNDASKSYFVAGTRQRNYTVQPAFFAEMHTWLMPRELAAMNVSTSADVIVIGAGVAGLAAAKALYQQSLNVIVLEARDRMGGRVQSIPYQDSWAELGAAYIYGSESGIDLPAGNPITTAANILSLPRMMVSPGSRTVFGSGSQRLGTSGNNQLQSWMQDFDALVSLASDNASLADVAAQLAQARGLAGANLQTLGTQLAVADELRYCGPLDQLSSLYFDNSSTFGGVDDIVTGGYSRVVDLLASGLPSVRLNSPVASIEHSDSLATVNLTTGERLTAQYVICTVPLGVLKANSLYIMPPPPLETAAAIDALGFGLVNKVFLYFDQVFWDATSEAIIAPARSGADACAWPLFTNLWSYTQAPVLVAHACGDFAQQLESSADDAVVASVMAVLQVMYPGAPQPQQAYVSRWGSDPYSLGSDSFYAVGSTPTDRATLAEPASGSLVFAGEAASVRYPATVHGAYLSGVDAAQRVWDSLLLPADCVMGSSHTDCASGGDGTDGTCADACWIEQAAASPSPDPAASPALASPG